MIFLLLLLFATPVSAAFISGATVRPVCQRFALPETLLTGNTNGATEDEALFTLPANGKVLFASIEHTAAFTGGSLTSMTVSLGCDTAVTGCTATLFGAAFDVFQAPGNTKHQDTLVTAGSPNAAAYNVIARFTPDASHAVSAATAGSVNIWVCWWKLP